MKDRKSPTSAAQSPVVSFLFLDHIHHVHHTAPIAFELAALGADVRLLSSTDRALGLLRALKTRYPAANGARIERLETWPWHRAREWVRRRRYPRTRFVIRRHARRLLDSDAIVAPDFYVLHLLKYRTRGWPKLVFAFHGAGDREYEINPRLRCFDLLLLPGRKPAQRVETLGPLNGTETAIVGYAKFDVCTHEAPADLPGFDRSRPTVLYTPHFEPSVSSWHRFGLDVLEWFYASHRYNLIFAPHIMLFARKNPRRVIPARYFDAPHIHIDTGSVKSVDMTYARAADIYLGDVSSQVYEFVALEPRPCVFLDAHGVDWEGDPHYLCYRLGTVVTSLDDFERAFREPPRLTREVLGTQRELVAATYSRDPSRTAGARAAEAILAHLERSRDTLPQAGRSANWSSYS